MVETSDNKLLTNNLLMEAYASEFGMKGLRVTPFINRQSTDAEIVNMYVREKTPTESIISDRTGKARRITEGARLVQVRGTPKTDKGRTLEFYGFEYYITNKALKQPGYSLSEDVKDLSAVICAQVERSVVNTLKSDANAKKATNLNKKWNGEDTTLEDIQSDLVDIDLAYDNDELLYDLNIMFHSKIAHGALQKKISLTEQKWEIPREGYEAQKALELGQIQHLYAGKGLSDGEMLAWDKNRPAATIYYGTEEGVNSPEVYEQLPDFAPMLMSYTEPLKGINPGWKIQIGCAWTVLTREPKGILFDNGFVA
jgi:hypothetical protein